MNAANRQPLTPGEQLAELRTIQSEVERLRERALRADAGMVEFLFQTVLAEVQAQIEERGLAPRSADDT